MCGRTRTLAQQRAKSCTGSQQSLALASAPKDDKPPSLLVDDIERVTEAAKATAAWDGIRQRLKVDPGSAKAKGAGGWLPLHAAAANAKVPLDVVTSLLRAYGAAAMAKDARPNFIVHCSFLSK